MKQPKGVLVLLALVMMAIFVTAGLVLGAIIIREVRLSTISDKGVSALYGAETAAEAAIYRVFKLGEDPSTIPGGGTLGNGASWTRETKVTDRRFIFDFLPQGQIGEINLYNKANINQAAGVESLSIDWTSGQMLNVSLYEWDGTNLTGISSNPFVCTASPCTPIIINTPVSTKAYQVLVAASGAPVTDLIVNVYLNDGGTGDPVQVDIPLTIVSVGEYEGAKQAVEMRVPSPAPWDGATPVTPPGAVCGNSVVESGETCDKNFVACTYWYDDGWSAYEVAGVQSCNLSCSGYGACVDGPYCGDGNVDAGELCDLNSQACTVGGASGTQTCNSSCDGWQSCNTCGNGFVEAGEVCDTAVTTNACITTTGGYPGNRQCNYNCGGWSACTSSQRCGDGVVNGLEVCDWSAGDPLCNGYCNGPSYCGDGVIQTPNGNGETEECEPMYNNPGTCDNTCQRRCPVGWWALSDVCFTGSVAGYNYQQVVDRCNSFDEPGSDAWFPSGADLTSRCSELKDSYGDFGDLRVTDPYASGHYLWRHPSCSLIPWVTDADTTRSHLCFKQKYP